MVEELTWELNMGFMRVSPACEGGGRGGVVVVGGRAAHMALEAGRWGSRVRGA